MSPSGEMLNGADTFCSAGLAETCRSFGGKRSRTTMASVAMLDSVIQVTRQVFTKSETMSAGTSRRMQ